MKKHGFAVKRRKWSDESAEQLIGVKAGEQLIVHAERADEGTFVRVAAILNA